MEKKIEDYLHLYLGTDCIYDVNEKSFKKLKSDDLSLILSLFSIQNKLSDNDKFRLSLRPLSDMTDEEMKEFILVDLNIKNTLKEVSLVDHATKIYYITTGFVGNSHMDLIRCSSDQFQYLLKQGFDLFGLIEAGLAINKTKI